MHISRCEESVSEAYMLVLKFAIKERLDQLQKVRNRQLGATPPKWCRTSVHGRIPNKTWHFVVSSQVT